MLNEIHSEEVSAYQLSEQRVKCLCTRGEVRDKRLECKWQKLFLMLQHLDRREV